MKLRVSHKFKLHDIYYMSLFIWSCLSVLSSYTTVEDSLGIPINTLYNASWVLVRIGLLLVIAFDIHSARTIRNMLVPIVVLGLGIISYYESKSVFLYSLTWFMAASRGIDRRKAVETIFWAQCIVALLTIGLSSVGIIENTVVLRPRVYTNRYCMGYNHPNVVGISLLQICAMRFFLNSYHKRCFSMLFREYILYGVSFFICYFWADSRTSAALIILLAAITTLMQLAVNRGLTGWLARKLIKWSSLVFPVVLSFSLVTSLGILKISFSDYTLQERVRLGKAYLSEYGISLFGQEVSMGYQDGSSLYTLDNSYVYLLLGFGIVFFVLFMGMYVIRIRLALQRREYTLLLIFALYAVLGFSETALIRFVFNFSLLMLSDLLWSDCSIGVQQKVKLIRYRKQKRKWSAMLQ